MRIGGHHRVQGVLLDLRLFARLRQFLCLGRLAPGVDVRFRRRLGRRGGGRWCFGGRLLGTAREAQNHQSGERAR